MSILISKSNNAVSLSFENYKMEIVFEDSRELSIPLEWFPKLRNATENELNNWRFIGDGEGVHWKDLDEDILIENLLN
ncbi:Protein of unknown function (DUF3532) [Aequorivita sublithincola DSM 14238]|uniref:DUF2442 domain-containing protein n=1 Tax=Aequorivita sublithincola (strain DSM 14238 / LMG 21431 / ACAM 643 / 9-3) TaxID=746697 RepID=I3YVG5_AEQSU|nr:DUF2442 domain-containing protein [Aequorivita sublithincola]AFL80983.1 Protein of unknown function (DUF3532) [Aequorivita sublithincola DSM 14238]